MAESRWQYAICHLPFAICHSPSTICHDQGRRMPTYATPGVYKEEVFLAPAAELRTGVPAFLGVAREDAEEPVDANRARPLTLWSEFVKHFGAPLPHAYLAYAVRGFFENDGQLCYVVRLDDTVPAVTALRGGLEALAPLDS